MVLDHRVVHVGNWFLALQANRGDFQFFVEYEERVHMLPIVELAQGQPGLP